MNTLPLLTLTTFLPVLGSIFILIFARGEDQIVARNAKQTALAVSGVTFLLSLLIWQSFDTTSSAFQLVEKHNWLPEIGISYHMGVDGISMLFILLSTLLTPICILASWEVIQTRIKEYMVAFLVLETMMIGMFCALDMILFYMFFEAVLIPMFIIIGVWGGANRVYAAFKLFLYTLAGSVLMLLAIIAMYYQVETTDILDLMAETFSPQMQFWLWLAFFASFAVKVPMWPVHTWLPDAHVQAPTAGSVILAGVLLKMGAYGFVRFSIPMLPIASSELAPLIFGLSIVALIYTSLVALVQQDMKKLIAYSSVAHMGMVTIGLFSVTEEGVTGALFQMLSHGIVSGALFLCVGVVYDRMHTRDISRYGGVIQTMPIFSVIFMIFMLASVGLPGTSGFVGEILVLVGIFKVSTWTAALSATGVILGAAYMLVLYRRVIFGPLVSEEVKALTDVNRREIAIFVPLIILVFWMGIYPSSFTRVMDLSVQKLVTDYQAAVTAQASTNFWN